MLNGLFFLRLRTLISQFLMKEKFVKLNDMNYINITLFALTVLTMIKNFCDLCQYATIWKSALKIHKLNHSVERKFKCSYATNNKGNLKKHELNHSGERKFKCSTCCYATNRKSDVKRQLLKHAGERKFKCSSCSYTTNRKDHLKKT